MSFGSPPFVLRIEEKTFGQPFRRGQETRAEQTVNKSDGEPELSIPTDKASSFIGTDSNEVDGFPSRAGSAACTDSAGSAACGGCAIRHGIWESRAASVTWPRIQRMWQVFLAIQSAAGRSPRFGRATRTTTGR